MPKGNNRGSAAVEFVFVSVPLVLLSMTVVSIALSSFAMAVLRDSAVEGARYAALADQVAEDGCQRAYLLADRAIGKFSRITADCEILSDQYSVVSLRADIQLFGLLPSVHELRASSRAPLEN